MVSDLTAEPGGGEPGSPYVLRSLVLADAGEVLTVQRAAFVAEAQHYDDPWLPALTQTLAELEQEIRTSRGIVAVTRGRVVGVVRMRTFVDTLYVNRLAVAPDCQRQGIGGALLRAAEQSTPASHASLSTGPRSGANLRFYQRRGYILDTESPRRAETDYLRLTKVLRLDSA
ncbi:GNAT family N-acetyltransferase [Actinopolymorpha pittospori]